MEKAHRAANAAKLSPQLHSLGLSYTNDWILKRCTAEQFASVPECAGLRP